VRVMRVEETGVRRADAPVAVAGGGVELSVVVDGIRY